MNTISLVLNGRTAASIALLPEKQRASITTLPPNRRALFRTMSASTISAPSSGASTPRPGSSKSSTPGSGWYNQENNPTLDDYARRLNTASKKIEIWQGKCAQNVVMALMRPTPIVLFALNPICLILYVVLGIWWMASGGGRSESEVAP